MSLYNTKDTGRTTPAFNSQGNEYVNGYPRRLGKHLKYLTGTLGTVTRTLPVIAQGDYKDPEDLYRCNIRYNLTVYYNEQVGNELNVYAALYTTGNVALPWNAWQSMDLFTGSESSAPLLAYYLTKLDPGDNSNIGCVVSIDGNFYFDRMLRPDNATQVNIVAATARSIMTDSDNPQRGVCGASGAWAETPIANMIETLNIVFPANNTNGGSYILNVWCD